MELLQRVKDRGKNFIKKNLIRMGFFLSYIRTTYNKILIVICNTRYDSVKIIFPTCNANLLLLNSAFEAIKKNSVEPNEYFTIVNGNIDSFSGISNKNILVVTHELSLTGAPIVVLDAVKVLLQSGYRIVVASPFDGSLRQEYQKLGVPIIIDNKLSIGRFEGDSVIDVEISWYRNDFLKHFNCIFISTFVGHNLVFKSDNPVVPIFWWLHEGSYTYDYAKTCGDNVPKIIPDNVFVYCGGTYASEMLSKYGYSYNNKVLLYGVEEPTICYRVHEKSALIKFLIVGTIDERKAQDIILESLHRMNTTLFEKAMFTFIGEANPFYINIFAGIENSAKSHDNIKVLPPMPRNALYKFYQEADCLICSSRDDPMPVVVTEMLALSKPVICSTNVGQSRYIQDGINGYIFETNNVNELLEKIEYVVINPSQARTVGKMGRLLYEKYFTMDIFRKNLLREINTVIQGPSDNKGVLS